MILIKNGLEQEKMGEGAQILIKVMTSLLNEVKIGVSTRKLDKIADRLIRDYNAVPSFFGYNGFPASICTSVNDEIVHGIPSQRCLRNGDIFSVDIGVYYKGFHSDMAVTVPVGNISKQDRRLINIAKESLKEAVKYCNINSYLGDISHAIEKKALDAGFSVVRDYVGHGIGRALHEDPQIRNYGKPGTGVKLAAGMAFAIEPMVNAGIYKTKVLSDDWTVVTKDGRRSAHFEHTVLITNDGPRVLTELEV